MLRLCCNLETCRAVYLSKQQLYFLCRRILPERARAGIEHVSRHAIAKVATQKLMHRTGGMYWYARYMVLKSSRVNISLLLSRNDNKYQRNFVSHTSKSLV